MSNPALYSQYKRIRPHKIHAFGEGGDGKTYSLKRLPGPRLVIDFENGAWPYLADDDFYVIPDNTKDFADNIISATKRADVKTIVIDGFHSWWLRKHIEAARKLAGNKSTEEGAELITKAHESIWNTEAEIFCLELLKCPHHVLILQRGEAVKGNYGKIEGYRPVGTNIAQYMMDVSYRFYREKRKGPDGFSFEYCRETVKERKAE